MNSPLAQQSRALQRCCLKQAALTREAQRRLEEYVQRMRAAGASWQAIGAAIGITRQSAWERFRHLSVRTAERATASRRPQPAPRYSPKQRRRDKVALMVQRMRAAGASWQTVGTALGITRQSAWERFRHIRASPKNIPEAVLQARHLQPWVFREWVTEAAKTDMQVKQWLETPNIDFSDAQGYNVPVPPINQLGTMALRAFLMVAGHDGVAPVPPPQSVNCSICGRSYLNNDYLRSHQARDHPEIGRSHHLVEY